MQVSGFRIYFLEPGYFFSKILSEFRKKIVALHRESFYKALEKMAAFGGRGLPGSPGGDKRGQDTRYGFLSPLDSPYLPLR